MLSTIHKHKHETQYQKCFMYKCINYTLASNYKVPLEAIIFHLCILVTKILCQRKNVSIRYSMPSSFIHSIICKYLFNVFCKPGTILDTVYAVKFQNYLSYSLHTSLCSKSDAHWTMPFQIFLYQCIIKYNDIRTVCSTICFWRVEGTVSFN